MLPQKTVASRIRVFHFRIVAAILLGLVSGFLVTVTLLPASARGESKQGVRSKQVATFPAVPSATPGWALVNSPNANNGVVPNYLLDTQCLSSSDCWAVGYHGDSFYNIPYGTLAEHWNGSAWSVVSSPSPSSTGVQLSSVTCVTATNCWAVGYYLNSSNVNRTLIEHWDGIEWTITSSPNFNATTDNYLGGVSCSSSNQCWAIGYYQVAGGGNEKTLIEKWNGSSWVIVTSPNPSSLYNQLNNVTCVAASDCWSVGRYLSGGSYRTLIQRWNGTSWATVASANGTTSNHNELLDVVCVSSSDCFAVGYYLDGSSSQRTLIEHWNGTSWAVSASPNGDGNYYNILRGVSCASSSDCWAAGEMPNNGALIEHWNGSAWTVVSAPVPSDLDGLYAVSCVSTADCWGVGERSSALFAQTIAEHWNGTSWSVAASTNVNDGAQENSFADVTCVSGNNCWAVGYHKIAGDNTTLEQPFIEHWDGTSWRVVNSPTGSLTEDSRLRGVSCSSAVDCWAVGNIINEPLVVHWTGNSWSLGSAPNPEDGPGFFQAVVCTSALDCWAVGTTVNSQTLIEHWNGTSWSVATSPNSGPWTNYLTDVTCTSTTNCWAVGFGYGSQDYQTLIEHWDGLNWSIVASPNTNASVANRLNSVTCVSSLDCWAVGTSGDSDSDHKTLTEHWNGTVWSIVPSPNVGVMRKNDLNGIACAGGSECWAVGEQDANGPDETLILQWDGSAWTIAASPNPVNSYSFLNGVTCSARFDCWAVGSYASPGTASQTMIEHFAGTPLQITAFTRSGSVFSIIGHAPAALQIEIQATSNLQTPFITIGSTTSDLNGNFHFNDAGAVGASKRFYRASMP